MYSRNEYLKELQGRYFMATSRKKELKIIYRSLNPAELKRKIEEKTSRLYRAYEGTKRTIDANPLKKQRPRSVRNYMIQPSRIGLGR